MHSLTLLLIRNSRIFSKTFAKIIEMNINEWDFWTHFETIRIKTGLTRLAISLDFHM